MQQCNERSPTTMSSVLGLVVLMLLLRQTSGHMQTRAARSPACHLQPLAVTLPPQGQQHKAPCSVSSFELGCKCGARRLCCWYREGDSPSTSHCTLLHTCKCALFDAPSAWQAWPWLQRKWSILLRPYAVWGLTACSSCQHQTNSECPRASHDTK